MESTILQNIKAVKPINQSLPEQVAEQIRQLILERQIGMNEKLPNEFELATQLNVGRGTVREAVKLLVARNVLEIRRGKGTYLAQEIGKVNDPLGLAYIPDQMRVAKDLLEIRLHLEPWIAALAAERATDADIAEMQSICAEVEELINEGKDHLSRDEDLHMAIAAGTHNDVMPRLVPIITYSVQLFGRVSQNTLLQETVETHRRILTAIAAHDPDAAAQAMRDHVLRNKQRILEIEAQGVTNI